MNPCSGPKHVEDLERPGFCLWCRAPLPELVATVDGHARTERPGERCSCVFRADGTVESPCPEHAALAALLAPPVRVVSTALDFVHEERCEQMALASSGAPAIRCRLQRGHSGLHEATRPPPLITLEPLRRWRDDPGVSLVCSACGVEFPNACLPDCPRPPDSIAVLLGAVSGGATLMLTGPDLLGDRTIAATLESASGASYASVEGPSIGPVLVELARRWLLERAPGEQIGHDPQRQKQQASNEPPRAADLEQRRETAAPLAPSHVKPSRTR